MPYMKKVVVLATTISLVLLATGCSVLNRDKAGMGGSAEELTDSSTSANDVVQLPLPEGEELDFSLESNEGVDLSNTPDYSDQLETEQEPTYIEKDGYAWLLDPVTFEIADGPFDPVTHERVQQGEEVLSPSQETPTDETMYPNTGIFLEDD